MNQAARNESEKIARIRAAMLYPARVRSTGPAGVYVHVSPDNVALLTAHGWLLGPGVVTYTPKTPDPAAIVMFRRYPSRAVARVVARELNGGAPEPDATTEPLDGYLQAYGDAVRAFAAAHEALQRCHADAVASGGLETVPAGSRAAMLRFADEVHTAAAKLWRAS